MQSGQKARVAFFIMCMTHAVPTTLHSGRTIPTLLRQNVETSMSTHRTARVVGYRGPCLPCGPSAHRYAVPRPLPAACAPAAHRLLARDASFCHDFHSCMRTAPTQGLRGCCSAVAHVYESVTGGGTGGKGGGSDCPHATFASPIWMILQAATNDYIHINRGVTATACRSKVQCRS